MSVIGDGSGSQERKEQRREVKMMLRRAMTDMHVKMVSDRDYTCTGLQYTDEFMSYLEVLSAMGTLPWWQQVALVRNVGPERATQELIADTLGVTRVTVCRYILQALDTMRERIYENP